MSRSQRIVLLIGLLFMAANLLLPRNYYGIWFFVFNGHRFYNFPEMVMRQLVFLSVLGAILWSLRPSPRPTWEQHLVLWFGVGFVTWLALYCPDREWVPTGSYFSPIWTCPFEIERTLPLIFPAMILTTELTAFMDFFQDKLRLRKILGGGLLIHLLLSRIFLYEEAPSLGFLLYTYSAPILIVLLAVILFNHHRRQWHSRKAEYGETRWMKSD